MKLPQCTLLVRTLSVLDLIEGLRGRIRETPPGVLITWLQWSQRGKQTGWLLLGLPQGSSGSKGLAGCGLTTQPSDARVRRFSSNSGVRHLPILCLSFTLRGEHREGPGVESGCPQGSSCLGPRGNWEEMVSVSVPLKEVPTAHTGDRRYIGCIEERTGKPGEGQEGNGRKGMMTKWGE